MNKKNHPETPSKRLKIANGITFAPVGIEKIRFPPATFIFPFFFLIGDWGKRKRISLSRAQRGKFLRGVVFSCKKPAKSSVFGGVLSQKEDSYGRRSTLRVDLRHKARRSEGEKVQRGRPPSKPARPREENVHGNAWGAKRRRYRGRRSPSRQTRRLGSRSGLVLDQGGKFDP